MPLGLLLLVLDLSNLIIPLVLRIQLPVDVFEAAQERLQLVQRPPWIISLFFIFFFFFFGSFEIGYLQIIVDYDHLGLILFGFFVLQLQWPEIMFWVKLEKKIENKKLN